MVLGLLVTLLFYIRFSYNHCNFSRVCLLVKIALKIRDKVYARDYHFTEQGRNGSNGAVKILNCFLTREEKKSFFSFFLFFFFFFFHFLLTRQVYNQKGLLCRSSYKVLTWRLGCSSFLGQNVSSKKR